MIGLNVADCTYSNSSMFTALKLNHQVILILRTFAIWDTDRRVFVGLFALLLGMFTVEAFYLGTGLKSLQCQSAPFFISIADNTFTLVVMESPDPSMFLGCFVAQASARSVLINYIALLVFETGEAIFSQGS